jgi:hypothetical protein
MKSERDRNAAIVKHWFDVALVTSRSTLASPEVQYCHCEWSLASVLDSNDLLDCLTGLIDEGLSRYWTHQQPTVLPHHLARASLISKQEWLLASHLLQQAQAKGERASGIGLATIERFRGNIQYTHRILQALALEGLDKFDQVLHLRGRGCIERALGPLETAAATLKASLHSTYPTEAGSGMLNFL